jgi:hypothetical protein
MVQWQATDGSCYQELGQGDGSVAGNRRELLSGARTRRWISSRQRTGAVIRSYYKELISGVVSVAGKEQELFSGAIPRSMCQEWFQYQASDADIKSW